ncbi:hypothetical protein A2Z22_04510 [Candidatus Woesebacteria bacterium RBG_16_34_12]|uniref:Excinuclease ABC subunit C n=1 Tax=Candidatus Woesebacteria bacterium RBG_16_34_12 TaxID=1802480 RepID=A0A1F7XBL2_9BACT|nr:MAG: hypothetical protein A2Z22_04510 [Candidatus Woesebacteria bacterium RBG_16_34_12]
MISNIFRLNKIDFSKNNLNSVPEIPGIYIFWKENSALYIGKAINLKKRIASYFSLNLYEKTKRLIREVNYFSFIKVNSNLESLLLEAYLIKKIKPKYNVSLKDDKNYLYIKITNEKYPRVLTARKKDEDIKDILFIGPFPSANNVKIFLKSIRKIFPYSDHNLQKNKCLYSQIGLCDPCPSEIEIINNLDEKYLKIKEYKKNISLLKNLLKRRVKSIRKYLFREMKYYSRLQKFEKALDLKTKIENLDYITQATIPVKYYIENPNLYEDIRKKELNELKKMINQFYNLKYEIFKNKVNYLKKLNRIECYDISHFSGNFTSASMVTFINGVPEKNLYRYFRIKQKLGGSDTDSLKEVALRRLKYLHIWGSPDLVIVDGGKAQVSAFTKIFKEYNIPVVGLVKGKKESLVININLNNRKNNDNFSVIKIPYGNALNLVQRIRNEAHRFAQKYHHHLFNKSLIPER